MVPNPGQSTVEFESPDTTVWRFRGDVSEEAMRSLTAREKQLIDGQVYLLKLVDMSRAGNITPGARKAGAEKVHDVPVLAVAIFGANFAIRVVANLVIRAGSVMRKIDTVPTQFFETEGQGRAWLASKREEIQKNPALPPITGERKSFIHNRDAREISCVERTGPNSLSILRTRDSNAGFLFGRNDMRTSLLFSMTTALFCGASFIACGTPPSTRRTTSSSSVSGGSGGEGGTGGSANGGMGGAGVTCNWT